MARSTLPRDYDIGRTLLQLVRDVALLMRRVSRLEGFSGAAASTTVSTTQTVTAATPAALPSPVTASIDLPRGSFRILASVAGLLGGGVTFNANSTGTLSYALSGAITFTPGNNATGVAGASIPVAAGGGGMSQVHEVTLASPATLTIQAMAERNITGSDIVQVRGVTVQLTVIDRSL